MEPTCGHLSCKATSVNPGHIARRVGGVAFSGEQPEYQQRQNRDHGVFMGGVNAMATAFGKKSKNPPIELSNAKFAAHIAFYPVCDVWVKME